MYAVIQTGGKQYRVEKGQTLDVELLGGDKVDLSPVLIVDGDKILATPDELSGAKVSARVVGDAKGPKITGFTYKGSTHGRRRWGHRQKYSRVEITGISKGSGSSTTKSSETSKGTASSASKASGSSTAKKAPASKATEASSKTTASKATTPAKKAPAAKKTTASKAAKATESTTKKASAAKKATKATKKAPEAAEGSEGSEG